MPWRLFLAVVVGHVIGCAPPVRVHGGPDGAFSVGAGVQLGWATKIVATKQPPATLVAEDGTVCRVAPDRYADTKFGALVACEWQPGEPPGDPPQDPPADSASGATREPPRRGLSR